MSTSNSTPAAPRRNPFKPGGLQAKQFDSILVARAKRHRDLDRGRGNAWASAFWKGYDNVRPLCIPRNSLAWACYRAGQFQRLQDDKAKVKT